MNAKQRRQEARKFKYRVRLTGHAFSERNLTMNWLKDNNIVDWRSPEYNLWKFANKEDAVLFKLRWM